MLNFKQVEIHSLEDYRTNHYYFSSANKNGIELELNKSNTKIEYNDWLFH